MNTAFQRGTVTFALLAAFSTAAYILISGKADPLLERIATVSANFNWKLFTLSMIVILGVALYSSFAAYTVKNSAKKMAMHVKESADLSPGAVVWETFYTVAAIGSLWWTWTEFDLFYSSLKVLESLFSQPLV